MFLRMDCHLQSHFVSRPPRTKQPLPISASSDLAPWEWDLVDELGKVVRGAEVLPFSDSSPPSAVPAKEKESGHRATPLEVQREYFQQAMELYAISDPEANTAHVTEAAHKAALEGVRAEAMRISKEGQLDKDWKVAYEEAVSALCQGTSSSDGTTLVQLPPVARARAKKSSSPTIYEELLERAENRQRNFAKMREPKGPPQTFQPAHRE